MRKLLIPIAVVALALGLAACGGGDDEESATTAPATTAAAEPAAADIVDTAVAAGDFTTLAAALEAAGLVETLKGEGPFTVFAPTDAAFAKLPEGTVEDLLLPENEDQLASILQYHVVEGAVPSTELSNGQSVGTLEGGELQVAIDDSGLRVDEATVTAADVETSNGVIHVIDTVLLPAE